MVDLLEGKNAIGLKWVYKTKFAADGSLEKHKARLVAKGYAQQHGIDFEEIFSSVARFETMRIVLALAAQQQWSVYQFDVKSAFLNGELQEEVYVEQSSSKSLVAEFKSHMKNKFEMTDLEMADAQRFRSLVGGLIYLTHTRPNILYSIGVIFSDWASSLDDRRSVSANVFTLGSGVITWSSKKHATVALSSSKEEYVAATSAACQAIWLRRMLTEL
ncbi:putative gag-pol polyprotein, identical [Cucumis melo var. makuwa]|uniref:Putative gag-pol polyprotein, identical n=1 Tax=Cucumis melo var. makuwa TaxID=1194695 RepID=A0A5D3BEF4_CUCMM|nr:putative gag-pol polyprotein, identical [Cucumis melo var. makuwa]